MADTTTLHRYDSVLRGIALEGVLDGSRADTHGATPVLRNDESTIDLAAVRALFEEFSNRREASWGKPSERPSSDSWLAPRLHACLRLTRAQASDKGVWHWLAIAITPEYLEWRWGARGVVNDDRWYGPIHKQALARLWWGAEMFRDGANYEPVERAFKYQDLINSFLHRVVTRCRSFSLGLLNALTESGTSYSSRQVNDLARVLNLCAAGRPPEAAVAFQADHFAASLAWAAQNAPVPVDWNARPEGPAANDTTVLSLAGGRALADHGIVLAGLKGTTT